MTHDIDDPARRAAEEAYITGLRQDTSMITVHQPEGPKLPVDYLLEFRDQIDEDRELVADRTQSEGFRIIEMVLERAPRLTEIDPDLFPELTVVRGTTVGTETESTMRLLEVPGSGRAHTYNFEVLDHRFTASVAYITPDGGIVDLASTRRQKGKRVVYVANEMRDTSTENVANFREGILDALDEAAYRGICTPKNHRPVPTPGS
jgi:hypothetical protein